MSQFFACSRQAQTEKEKQSSPAHYLPDFLKEIELGQAQSKVLSLRPKLYPVNSFGSTQWEQYTEDLEEQPYTSLYYDFEKTGEKRLVALAILHKEEATAAETFNNFGGSLVGNSSQERERVINDQQKIYALKKGKRVTIMLPVARPKTMPSQNQ